MLFFQSEYKPKILVIEDNKSFCDILSQLLGPQDFTLILASDWSEAVTCLNEEKIDLILSHTTSSLESEEATSLAHGEVPVIFMSGYIEQFLDILPRFENAYFLEKPFSTKKLLAKISSVLSIDKNQHKEPLRIGL